MSIAVGIFLAVFGTAFVLLAPRLSRASDASSKEMFGTTGGKPMRVWNRTIFTTVGIALVVFGILYAIGVVG
ncbi:MULTISPECIES: hypothetical protein [Streptomyces]|uniref:hypothetical protein n=1 Tax=Streptomyces TaxID=1883 RepID=UPI000FD6A6A3|nr:MULTISPECIES: hypothetical protein [unclassified Streptomyces]